MPGTVLPAPDHPYPDQPKLDQPNPDLVAGLPVLRAMLEEQRQFRLEQLAALAVHAEPDPARREVTAALVVGATQALADIEAALGRMLTGRYGRCTRCRGYISVERLYVIPQAGRCVECQRAESARPQH